MGKLVYSAAKLKLLLKGRLLTVDEFRYYSACLRYVKSKSDLDRRVWLHIAKGLGKLLGREVIELGEKGSIGERVSEVV